MKRDFIFTILLFAVLTATVPIKAQDKSNLGDKQKAFLAKRLEKSPIGGNFDSLGNRLFAFFDVAIHTDAKGIGEMKLASPFPSIYKPTWKEVFDSIAIQTQTVWAYDKKREYWVFTPADVSPSFSIKVADKWTSQNRGIYIGYKPPDYPVGMDIYQMGTYSAENPKDEPKLYEEVRDALALRFVSGFKKDITIKEMETVKIDSADALFFEAASPVRPEVVWRQWLFVKNGKAFAIVSALNKEDVKSYKDVQAMVQSFQVK